jgi:phage-related protein
LLLSGGLIYIFMYIPGRFLLDFESGQRGISAERSSDYLGGRFAGCDQRVSGWCEAESGPSVAIEVEEILESALGLILIVMLQRGEQPTDYRPVTTLGSGVFELRSSNERAWYRVLYLSRIHDVIYVLHCFEKKSRTLPKNDAEVAQRRLKQVSARLAEEKRHGKRN